ncbi:MAG TPA: HPr family phosphocarrier protein [Sedimentisphaerales bacterium]|nr:HPr family phosphocarrier protein [Sedimentisphaerales bacterium]HRS12512.1 HPr family phosphocarrier protein [Sedimentisphaerales bacterium]HRV49150.1 HPr family phosphocarrier protein [Sedimentisphaerales bacterium]
MSATLVDEREFLAMMQTRMQAMLSLLLYLSKCESPAGVLTRPLLGSLLSEAVQLEEVLDSYDAGKNRTWCHARSLTAAVKTFADASYELLHIRHRLPNYRLLPVQRDFVTATDDVLGFLGHILRNVAREMVAEAGVLGLTIPQRDDIPQKYAEPTLRGHLPHNGGTRLAETGSDMVAETVTTLATEFLNLASSSEDVRAASRAKPEDYALCMAASLREESLRTLELRFHNLQSQYDTYVSGTQVESQDTDLPVLRGQASVVFHLLKIATLFAHFYERHVNKPSCPTTDGRTPLVKREELLYSLMKYAITFIDQYIGCTISLCQEMLKRYAEEGQIEVPIPKYRGFHVRPATLVSKLVLHYGSHVRMRLGEETYDAGSSLDLFRANEQINAQKRRWLAQEIVRLGLVPENTQPPDVVGLVRNVILTLAAKGKLILYEQPLQLPDRLCPTEGTALEKVTSETGRLLAMGKIDIGTDITATFVGDKRVLEDIRLLAQHGYGEDSFGNNIALPDKLAYLRR